MLKKIFVNLQYAFPSFMFFIQSLSLSERSLCWPGVFWKPTSTILTEYHDRFRLSGDETLAVDLGSGPHPKNLLGAGKVIGLDVFESDLVKKVHLGLESIPFPNSSVDCVTAYDVLEHIPRASSLPNMHNPFIFLINEIYRILRPSGLFISLTPVFPFTSSVSDPTHVNIITADTFSYFTERRVELAKVYGVYANFEIVDQAMIGDHLLCVMRKLEQS